MGGSKRAALVTLLLFSLLLFQNCSSSLMSGSDQISNTSQQNSPNIATDLIQPISLVKEKEDSIFRGDRVNISISKSDFNFPDEFIVQTVSATAQSGFDFINIDRKFNFENNQDVIQLSIETLMRSFSSSLFQA